MKKTLDILEKVPDIKCNTGWSTKGPSLTRPLWLLYLSSVKRTCTMPVIHVKVIWYWHAVWEPEEPENQVDVFGSLLSKNERNTFLWFYKFWTCSMHCTPVVLALAQYTSSTPYLELLETRTVMNFYFYRLDAGCCLIPFCIDGCKDTIHTCPNCGQIIVRRNRL